MFPTVTCAEHWLRPHSDERPGLPCWDVSPNQTPASHHAPVTVAAYSRAHCPQSPGQGGLLSHINISFGAAAIHRRTETSSTIESESVSVALCCCLYTLQLWTRRAEIPCCFKVWNEHIIVPRRLAVPAENAHYFHSCCAVVFSVSQAAEVSGQRLPKVQSAHDRDLWESALSEVPEGSPGRKKKHRRRQSSTYTVLKLILSICSMTCTSYSQPSLC